MTTVQVSTHRLEAASLDLEYPTASLYSGLLWNRAFASIDGTSHLHVAEQVGEGVGWLATHLLVDRTPNPVYDSSSIAGLTARIEPDSWYPQLLLGARNGQYNPANVPEVGAPDVLSALVGSAELVGSASLAWLYADSDSAQKLLDLKMGFVPYLSDVDSSIRVAKGGLDEFIASLPSNRRSVVRRDVKRAGGLPAVRVMRSDEGDLLTKYAELAVQTQTRHGQSPSVAGMTTYLEKCVAAGHPAVVFFYGPLEKPTAFSLAIAAYGTLWMRLVGLNYDDNGNTEGQYPGVLAIGPAVYAAEHGLGSVNVGAGTSDFKRYRGAKATPRWSLLRPPPGTHIDLDAVWRRNLDEAERLHVDAESLLRMG